MKQIILCCLSLILFSCNIDIDPERPSTGEYEAIPLKPSNISLPLELDIASLQGKLNKLVPDGILHHQNHIPGFYRGDIIVYKDKGRPIHLSQNKDHLRINIPLRIYAYAAKRKKLPLGVKVTKTGKGNVNINVVVDVLPKMNANYEMDVKTKVAYDLTKAKIRISLLGDIGEWFGDPHVSVSVRSRVRPLIDKKLPQIEKMLKAEIKKGIIKANLKGEVAAFWKNLGNPIALDTARHIYLESNPQKISFSNLKIGPKKIITGFGVESILSVVNTPNPKYNEKALPKLDLVNRQNGKFQINLPIIIDYEALETQVNVEMKDALYYSKDSTYQVKIKAIEIFGSQTNYADVLVAGLKFEAKGSSRWKGVKGKLWVIINPGYDKEQGTLFVQSLKLSPETNSLLIDKGVPWLLDLFYTDDLKELLQYKVSEELDMQKNDLNKKFARIPMDDLTLSGKLSKISFEGFAINEKSLDLGFIVEGEVNVKL